MDERQRKSEEKEQRAKEAQKRFFGKRFIGATLSKLYFPDEVSKKIANWIVDKKNMLVAVGPPGTGKTFFCAAMVRDVFDGFQNFRYYSERGLFRTLRKGISETTNGDYLEHLHLLLDDNLIIIDDVGSSGHTEWRQEVLMEAIDFRYESMLPTIVTSNLYRDDFCKTYGPRITSRLFAKENTIVNLENMSDMRQV